MFTNVPIAEAINIICRNVYHHPTIPSPPFNDATLRKLLLACTSGCPFLDHQGKIYKQNDGVPMGSPLGVTFANYYMCNLENEVSESDPTLKPTIYCRYVDDCFLVVETQHQLDRLVDAFQSNSVLNFTIEKSSNHTFHFLDVNIEQQEGIFKTDVYKKDTNSGINLHTDSECPETYKNSTVRAMIHRTHKICSSDKLESSLNALQQVFVNNGYSNKTFNKILSDYKTKLRANPTSLNANSLANSNENLAEHDTADAHTSAGGAERASVSPNGSADHLNAPFESDNPHVSPSSESDVPRLEASSESDIPRPGTSSESDIPRPGTSSESGIPRPGANSESEIPSPGASSASDISRTGASSDSDIPHLEAASESDVPRSSPSLESDNRLGSIRTSITIPTRQTKEF